MTAGTTSSITFTVRVGPAGVETTYLNGYAGRYFGGAVKSSIAID